MLYTFVIELATPPPSPSERVIAQALLTKADLPGWAIITWGDEEAPNGIGGYRSFGRRRNMPWIKVLHRVFVFENMDAAVAFYEAPNLPLMPRGEDLPHLGYHSSTADSMRITCISSYINDVHHYPCDVVARYGTVVSVVRTMVFEDQWMTQRDFHKLLGTIDRRMVEVLN